MNGWLLRYCNKGRHWPKCRRMRHTARRYLGRSSAFPMRGDGWWQATFGGHNPSPPSIWNAITIRLCSKDSCRSGASDYCDADYGRCIRYCIGGYPISWRNVPDAGRNLVPDGGGCWALRWPDLPRMRWNGSGHGHAIPKHRRYKRLANHWVASAILWHRVTILRRPRFHQLPWPECLLRCWNKGRVFQCGCVRLFRSGRLLPF